MRWITPTVCALVLASGTDAANWPGFRGDGSGTTNAKNLPLEWSAKKNLAWQITLPGYGQSSPVVWKDQVFITSCEGANKEKNIVAAYNLKTGKKAWQKELGATQKVKSSFSVSRAAPTPVVDAAGLYVFFESGELACFSHDGKQLWLRSLVKDYGEFKNGHGLGASLAQNADSVFVLIDHQGPSYLLSVNKKDGKNRWKEKRTSRASWTSPVLTKQGDKEFLVISSGGSVDVYDPKTGKQLSTYTDVGNNNVPSAVVIGDRVVVGASNPPRNPKQELTLKSNCCLTIDKDGKLSQKAVWTSKKAASSFASPLIHQGHAYFINSAGVLFCLDLKTGAEKYSARLNTSCWAAPLAAGDRIYFFDKNGTTTVIKTGPKFVKLATNKLFDATAPKATEAKSEDKKDPPKRQPGQVPAMFADPIVYGVAVTDDAILIRTGTKLTAVREKK